MRIEVRDAYRRLLEQGWTDAPQELNPGERVYTFWKYWRGATERNAGLRIDRGPPTYAPWKRADAIPSRKPQLEIERMMEDELTESQDGESKPRNPNERREQTDIVFREIMAAETEERLAKSAQLRQARLEAEHANH